MASQVVMKHWRHSARQVVNEDRARTPETAWDSMRRRRDDYRTTAILATDSGELGEYSPRSSPGFGAIGPSIEGEGSVSAFHGELKLLVVIELTPKR